MKKTFKSIISILLVMLLTFSCCSVALATDIEFIPGEIGPGINPDVGGEEVDDGKVDKDDVGFIPGVMTIIFQL